MDIVIRRAQPPAGDAAGGRDREDADRGQGREERAAGARAQRVRLRPSSAAEPVLHARHRHGVGRHVLVGSMRYGIRWPEELIMKALFFFHPDLPTKGSSTTARSSAGQLHARGWGRPHASRGSRRARIQRACLAGGDRSARTTLVHENAGHGHHRRRHAEGEHGDPPRHDLYPGRSGAVRLLPAALHRPRAAERSALAQGRDDAARRPNIFAGPTRSAGCRWRRPPGGERRVVQDREQWGSACNFVAMRPGSFYATGTSARCARWSAPASASCRR